MSTFQDRLRQAMAGPPKVSQAALARACGISAPSVNDWLSGKTKNIEGQNLLKAAEFLKVDPKWLATGRPSRTTYEGTKVHGVAETAMPWPAGESSERREPSNLEPMLQPTRAAKEYPMISWVAAGARAESPDNFEPGDAEEWLQSTENAGPGGYWVRVKGKSMVADTPPSFPEGTPILVQPEGFNLISGKFYIFKHQDGETTFKQYTQDAGRRYMTPLNTEFKQVDFDDEWRVIGRVIDAKITGL